MIKSEVTYEYTYNLVFCHLFVIQRYYTINYRLCMIRISGNQEKPCELRIPSSTQEELKVHRVEFELRKAGSPHSNSIHSTILEAWILASYRNNYTWQICKFLVSILFSYLCQVYCSKICLSVNNQLYQKWNS